MSEIKTAGELAFSHENKPREANPYKYPSAEHREWDQGYCSAFLREYGTGLQEYNKFWSQK